MPGRSRGRERRWPNVAPNGDEEVRAIRDRTVIAYKDFAFDGPTELRLELRGAKGTFGVKDERDMVATKTFSGSRECRDADIRPDLRVVHPLYLVYRDKGKVDLRSLTFRAVR